MPIKPCTKWLQTATPAFDNATHEQQVTRKEVIDLRSGDPVVWGFTYQALSNYLIDAAREGWHMYTEDRPWVLKELRTAIAEFENKYRGVEYSSENIVVAPGVAGALKVLHYAILEEGDEVVMLDPSHTLSRPTSYWSYLRAKPVACMTLEEENWKPDLSDMSKKISRKTKAIFINNPANPTGTVYDEKMIEEIVNVAGQHDIPVICDEIYGLITFDGTEATSVAKLSGEVPVLTLSGMSKIFMRTGWRVGYICIHDPNGSLTDVTRSIKKVAQSYGHGTDCIPTPILAAASRVYKNAVENGLQGTESMDMVRELQIRRDYTMKRFSEMGGVSCSNPKGACFAFPKIHGIGKVWRTDNDFLLDLVKEQGVVFAPGSIFGKLGQAHVRTLLLPKLEILEKVYNKLEEFLKKRGAS